MHPTISEELQDTMMSSDSEEKVSYQPPPHIAARFFKSAANRRKSSAASSRRNSLTSHHSSLSARSGHGRLHSTHVAQHLRRASIIESRKAKAADRNAHAEQVRLRAAMNKAAPRVTTTSTERTLAAQKARERYLAQVKANCAEEVKRSKRVAEEQREKRAAETLKMREEMEERHAEAERRKNLLQMSQRRPRTSTLPTNDESLADKKSTAYTWKPQTPAQAAPIIQRAWRSRRWLLAVQQFKELGLTVDATQRLKFEDASVLLSREDVVSATSKVLDLLEVLDHDIHLVQQKAAVRTFLTSFLITAHPGAVFSKDGEQEQGLAKKAQVLLSIFSRTLDKSLRELRSSDTSLPDLTTAWSDYQTGFGAWRSLDSDFMISGMVAQFVELDAIWQTVKNDNDGAVAEDYKEGIQHNQTLVLARLKRLVGHDKAMQMIRDAIRAARKARSKKQRDSKKDQKPRQAASSENAPSTTVLQTQAASSKQSKAPSDPTAFARAKFATSSLLPANRVITHEIAINKEWKIDTEQKAAQREEMITSISDSLRQGLADGLGEVWIPAIAESIREKLLSLLKPGNSLHTLISEALDPAMVASQVKHESFSYDRFFDFMNTILPQLCAPVRDIEVKSLANESDADPFKKLAQIYYIIEIIQLDMLNFTLQSWAPVLLKESSGYEARSFDREMEGKFPEQALEWWQQSKNTVVDELARRSGDPTPANAKAISAHRTYMQGLSDVAISTSILQPNEVPETLQLDLERLNQIRADILRVITVSSILLTAKNLLRRDVRSLWKAEAQRMWDLPFSSPPTAFVSIIESRYALPAFTKQQISGTTSRLLSDAREGQATHPVMKVLLKKIKAHVLSRLTASSAEERIRTSTTATETLGSGGMPEFVGRVSDIVSVLERVALVDRESHGSWYEKIAARAAEGDSDPAAGTSQATSLA